MPHNTDKLDELLSSLDGTRQAKAPDFFYTRLRGRMEREMDAGGPLVRLLTKPALAMSIAAFVLILNTTAIMEMWNQESPRPAETSQQQLASEYPMGTYPVYDETPVAP